MKIVEFQNFDSLHEHLGAWEALSAKTPMLSPLWIIQWWRTYQESMRGKLCFLAGFSGDQLVGFAPFYIEEAGRKRTLRFLGDGHVCSDHLTLQCDSRHEDEFVKGVAAWLNQHVSEIWNGAYWECIPENDRKITALVELLGETHSVYRRPACSSWYVELPATWDEYLSRLSKNHRKRCRRWYREWIDSGKVTHEIVTEIGQLDQAFQDLCELHNARRNFVHTPGAFEDPQFFEFHKVVTRELFAKNQLRLSFLRIDGKPMTCEYQFVDGDTAYSYQSGFDPQYRSVGAGNISLMMAVKSAIDDGLSTFDFLRGNEKYKQSWKAEERKTVDIHIHQKTLTGSLEQAKLGTKDWLRSVRSLVTAQ